MNPTWLGEDKPPTRPDSRAAQFDFKLATDCSDYRAALAYLPVGYPDQPESLRILHRPAEVSGVIEVGWPFLCSDQRNDRIGDDLR